MLANSRRNLFQQQQAAAEDRNVTTFPPKGKKLRILFKAQEWALQLNQAAVPA